MSLPDVVYVSRPLLPSIEQLLPYVRDIWESRIVTNNGKWNIQLEERLRHELNVPTALTFNNGTTGLLAALRFFDFAPGSEVITTPLTFAATAHAISWNGLIPVFVDCEDEFLTIDPNAVELAIGPKTVAVVGVHVYGNLCDDGRLSEICRKANIKLIYDAAHAFGGRYHGIDVGNLGDLSVFSLHATKLFNTLEGGVVTSSRLCDTERLSLLRNFGIEDEERVSAIGINGKMNELQAAIGLCNLDLVEQERAARARLRNDYAFMLRDIKGVTLHREQADCTLSEQYYLVRINEYEYGRSRNDVKNALEARGIMARKYFYPLCTDYGPYFGRQIISVGQECVAQQVKNEVLCLPFHSGVTEEHVSTIKEVLQHGQNRNC